MKDVSFSIVFVLLCTLCASAHGEEAHTQIASADVMTGGMARSIIPLGLGDCISAGLTGTQDIHYYRVDVEEGEHLLLMLDKPNWWYGRFCVALGEIPDTSDQCSLDSRYDQVLEIDSTEAGTYFIAIMSGRNPSYPYDWQYGSYTIEALTEEMLPTLAIGADLEESLDGTQDVQYYRLETTEGAHLLVTLDKPSWWYGRIYMAMGHLPTSGDASSVDSRYDQVIEIDPTEGGTYYIQVRSG